MPQPGFAVVDFETTGLIAENNDRIIEIAVVHVDESGSITGSWETLINPVRDLGPQAIHRIRSAEILGAPRFDAIAGQLIELLAGRAFVAHNASFETRFLRAEFRRMGVESPLGRGDDLCTMQLAQEFLPGAGRSLADCCAAYDIELVSAHRAATDATATARLLAAYMRSNPTLGDWHEHLTRAQQRRWPVLPALSTPWAKRAPSHAQPVHFLQRISIKLPEYSGPAEHVSYLALLDQCLLDRALSSHEATALVELAEHLGISRDTCARLHRVYLDDLTRIAWADGQLTEEEVAELRAVAVLLALDLTTIAAVQPGPARPLTSNETDQLSQINRFCLAPGDPIVLTGEMNQSRDQWHRELSARGFVVKDCITKRVKLLVAADPDSLSGKARKARDYRIPIVTEEGLIALLERFDSTAPAPI